MSRAVVLDLDGSVGAIPGACVLPLASWQERLRFACTRGTLRSFAREIAPRIPAGSGTVLLGSGDFHHLSWPLIERVCSHAPFQVVILDNHPDHMRFPIGVHCGSWVQRVARLERVSHVHVVGVTSHDVAASHAFEITLWPLYRRRVSFWCIGVDVGWAGRLGLGHAFRAFDDPAALVRAFADEQCDASTATYLSIDKDVFSEDVARTNWDQGRLTLADAEALISALPGPLIGSDITGEVSHYRYEGALKRWLAALDAQPPVDLDRLDAWQAEQHALNLALLRAIAARAAAPGPA